MSNNRKRIGFRLSAGELLKTVHRDPKKVEEMFSVGCVILADDETDKLIEKVMEALPKAVVTDIEAMAAIVDYNIRENGQADIGSMTAYLKGLTYDAKMAEHLEPLIPQEEDRQELQEAEMIGLFIVVAAILFTLLVLGSYYIAGGRRIGSEYDTLVRQFEQITGQPLPDWMNNPLIYGPIVIHGPNDPNGPIGPRPRTESSGD